MFSFISNQVAKILDEVTTASPLHTFNLIDKDITAVFNSLDISKNGTLDKSEFIQALQALTIGESTADLIAERVFAEFGTDNSKHSREITLEQFRHYVHKHQSNLLHTFERLNTDHDGYLTQAECAEFIQRIAPGASADRVAEIFNNGWDVDKDGRVSFQEFCRVMMPAASLSEQEVEDQYFRFSVIAPVSVTPTERLLAGLMSGIASRTATAPMDRLRSLMAAGGSSTLGESSGLFSGLRAMYRAGNPPPFTKGIKSMWQGNMANCIQVGPESALLFCFNSLLKAKLLDDPQKPTLFEGFMCGAGAGAMSMTAVYPMYVVQNRLLVSPEGYYKGIAHCFRKSYQEEGLAAFRKGDQASLVRILPYKGIDLAGYTALRSKFVPEGEQISTVQSLAFGSIASCVSQTCTHPLLLARTVMQCQGGFGRPVEYDNFIQVIRATFNNGGFRSLYNGLSPSLAKNVPAVAIQFAVYEKTLTAIRPYF